MTTIKDITAELTHLLKCVSDTEHYTKQTLQKFYINDIDFCTIPDGTIKKNCTEQTIMTIQSAIIDDLLTCVKNINNNLIELNGLIETDAKTVEDAETECEKTIESI